MTTAGELREQLRSELDGFDPPPVPLERIERQARTIRLRRGGIAGGAVAACVAVAAAVLITPASHPVTSRPALAPVAITNTMVTGPGGVFAQGTAAGRHWQLAVEDIADPGYQCMPGVTVNGIDADPLFADLHLPLESLVGNPAFVTLGSPVSGVGFAFIQVPADADRIWLNPVDGVRISTVPVTVSACGEQFRLVGFAYPLSGTVLLHASFTDRTGVSYRVPAAFSAPQPSLIQAQVDGLWQDMDAAHGQAAVATVAAGRSFGQSWSIQVTFGTAGDCFVFRTSFIDDSANAQPETMADCGPISTPLGPDTIMTLPLASPASNGPGIGYAVSVGVGTASLTATLSDGSVESVRPVVVDGRKYAAFFVAAPQRLTKLSWLNAGGQPIATATSLPQNGYLQFQP